MSKSALQLAVAHAMGIAAFGIAGGGAALAQPTSAAANADVAPEEVVVTARRREESLQEVPIAVTALSAAQLETLNVRTLEDITALAPNIKVNPGRATSSTINA